MRPTARSMPGSLRGAMKVLDGSLPRRRRLIRRGSLLRLLRGRLNRRVAGRDRFSAWLDKQMRMPPYQLPANAWRLWRKPRQIRPRLLHLGRLPRRMRDYRVSLRIS